MTGNAMYAVRNVPGKGKGLVAIERISKGTRILSEEPIITVPHDVPGSPRLQTIVFQQVEALSESQRHTFLSMHNIHAYRNPAEQYLGIVRTNALPIGTNGIDGGIFLEACLINHACDNNAQKNWNENIKRHTVHALRDIEQGKEITICYLAIVKNRKARQAAFQAKFGCTCSCRLCSLPPEQSQENDKRLDEIYRLENLIGGGGMFGILSTPLRILRYVDQQVQLYNEQGPGGAGLPRAFLDAARIAIANGDLARGRIFVEKAVLGWRTGLGSDSTVVAEYEVLAKDPSKHDLYGSSMAWRTALDEVPCGLEPGAFEDWLWKREKQQRPGQQVDLRNRTTFPGFVDLPDENVVDPDLYESSTYRPRRHWCFLAEIVHFSMLFRLQMEIKDIDGRSLPLFFYTDSRGSELPLAQVRSGYTVAILYAQRHAFVFDDPGIRHEDPRMIKIFPVPLRNLLAINDLIQQFSIEIDGLRTCHGCSKKAASLQRCAKCGFFWYCDRSCQAVGWNEKCHKIDCKLLRDSDLRGLFNLQWDKFDSHVQFPLHAAEKSMRPETTGGGKEDEGETLVQRVRRLGVSDNTVAAVDNTTSSDGPAAPESIPLAEVGTSSPEKTLAQRRAELQARATLKGGLRLTPESSADQLESASNTIRESIKDVVESTGKLYAIRAIAGKGKGLVATTRIAKGTRLLSEVPIFRVPRDRNDIKDLERIVADEVKCLGDDQRRAFFDLTNIYGNAHSEALGIARTNVLPLGSGARAGGLFLEASRINHSCRHNAQNTWNENIGRLTIHALRDIEAGQEITISYLVTTSEYAERWRFLKDKFKFECKCELCSLPRAPRKRSDTRLRKLEAIYKSVGAFFWGDIEPEMALRLLHTMFGLFDEEGIWNASIAQAYEDAYDIATDNEDESRARVFARRAYDTLRLIEGDDSSRTVKMKKAAEESSAQIPQGTTEAEFESWLWMLTCSDECS